MGVNPKRVSGARCVRYWTAATSGLSVVLSIHVEARSMHRSSSASWASGVPSTTRCAVSTAVGADRYSAAVRYRMAVRPGR